MPGLATVAKFNAPAWVTPEALNVTPGLLGMPLARPAHRAMAMGVDAAVVLLLSSSGAFWLLAGIAAVAFELRRRYQRAVAGRRVWLWVLLVLLTWLAAQQMLQRFSDPDGAEPEAALVAPATPIDATPAATAAVQAASQSQRIAELERQLALARQPTPFRWRDEAKQWGNALGLGFGWAIAYFSLLPFWWRGQTLGKRLFGLRVVELTGKPLTVLHCLGRYGGYAAGMATGMVGFAQVLWDANRQAIQDKIAHTVVVDLRQPRRDGSTAGAPAADYNPAQHDR